MPVRGLREREGTGKRWGGVLIPGMVGGRALPNVAQPSTKWSKPGESAEGSSADMHDVYDRAHDDHIRAWTAVGATSKST